MVIEVLLGGILGSAIGTTVALFQFFPRPRKITDYKMPPKDTPKQSLINWGKIPFIPWKQGEVGQSVTPVGTISRTRGSWRKRRRELERSHNISHQQQAGFSPNSTGDNSNAKTR